MMADQPKDQIIPKNNIDVVTDNKLGDGTGSGGNQTPGNEYAPPLGAMENRPADVQGAVGNEDLVAGQARSDAESARGQADKPGTGAGGGAGSSPDRDTRQNK